MTTKKDIILDTLMPELIKAYNVLGEEDKEELLDDVAKIISEGKI